MAKNNNSASFIHPAQPALCNLAQSAFQDKSSVYLFTNENVTEYIPPLDLTGARVLTVCASGDHALMSYLSGASHVDTFDINSYQKNIYELKMHMIRNLDFGAFHDFFFSRYNFFSRDIIRPFYGDPRFPNAICAEYTAARPDRIVVCAYDGERLMGMAGCSEDALGWQQIGIDVMPEYRSRGVGTYLVTLLKNKILERGDIPFYGTSLSNYHSWNVALGSGFRPMWVEIGSKRMTSSGGDV